jgi:biopolymer transport protein ExbD
MPFKFEPVDEPTINVTSMVDVVLLLLIFFMVGTQFTKQESQYEINLPQVTDAQPLTALPDQLVINVAADGSLYMGKTLKTAAEVETELRSARQRYADQVVVIRGDGQGPYQHVMNVLDICKQAHITNIQLANRIEGETGP